MTESELQAFRARILAEISALTAQDDLGQDAQRTVKLDQQSVGRLSRMDAMQQQAMAQATARRRAGQRQRLELALERLDAGEFGECADCADPLPLGRLELDPTATLCVSCAAG